MSTRGTSTAAIARATGIPWEAWTARLDELGARSMSHAELARRVAEQLEGVVDNHKWWAQSVTVALAHTGLASAVDVARWRVLWKDLLTGL